MAAEPESAALRALDRELGAIVSAPDRPIASLSVVAIRDGRVVYERQFGYRHIERGDPANASTLYRIASISKLVTALGVMRLAEEGKLDLDEDVGKYLGYRVRNPHFPDVPITLRALLSHTSSLRDDAGYMFGGAGHDMRGFLQGDGKQWSSTGPPGAYFTYCNLNSGVIGTIMEKVTGERFDRLMRRLVIEPLGLSGGFNVGEFPAERLKNVATLYRKATPGDVQVWDPAGPWIAQIDDPAKPRANRVPADYVIGSNGALTSPQGGLYASAADLARVMRMLMDHGMLDGRRFLQPRTIEAMFVRQWKWDGENGESWKDAMQAWGLGNQQWVDASAPGKGDRLVEGGGFTPVGHTGDAYGLHGGFFLDRQKREGIIFLASGTGFDPETQPGRYSGKHRYEEKIVDAIYRRALRAMTD